MYCKGVCMFFCRILFFMFACSLSFSVLSMSKKEAVKSCLYELNFSKDEILACLHENWSDDDHCIDMKDQLEECAMPKIIGF